MTGPSVVPLTGAQHEIGAGDYRAVVTELGAGLRQLTFRGRPVISGYPADQVPPAGSGQLLAPWPNRVDGGKYTFDGATHQLDLSEIARGNAIHGLTRWVSWTGAARGPAETEFRYRLLGQPGYPFCLELVAAYRLDADAGLRVTMTATNAGATTAPYGTGQHPYFTAGTALIDECELQLPAARWQAADERGIPVGEPADVTGTPFDFRTPRPIGDTRVDHAFTELSRDDDGLAWAVLVGPDLRLRFWADASYPWLQVFSGDALAPDLRRRALAIEPMTCPPNAFVTGTDLHAVAPGATVSGSWGIQAHHS
jgi:aldose 1-epimerase